MPEIKLRAATTGAEIAVLSAEPLELVAQFRRAVVAAGYGGPPELFCGLRLLHGENVLRDCETLEASGLAGGGAVDVVRLPALELWREGKVTWNTIDVPLGGPLCIGVSVRPVGRDRILAFPARPAWRRYSEELGDSASRDFIGKYEIMHHEHSDLWLIGANEPFALEGSVAAGSGYVSARQIPLPLPDPSQGIHAFDFQDARELQKGVLQKFRLCGIDEDDLRSVKFELAGEPTPFRFKFPDASADHDFRQPTAYEPVAECHDAERITLQSNSLRCYTLGRDRCGQVVATRGRNNQDPEDDMFYEICELKEDGGELKKLATGKVQGHMNSHCQALGDRLMLFAGPHAGEDAFYEKMRLMEWPTGEVIREIPLAIAPRYIEVEWERGILCGSTQTFFTCWTEECQSTTFAFATPEI